MVTTRTIDSGLFIPQFMPDGWQSFTPTLNPNPQSLNPDLEQSIHWPANLGAHLFMSSGGDYGFLRSQHIQNFSWLHNRLWRLALSESIPAFFLRPDLINTQYPKPWMNGYLLMDSLITYLCTELAPIRSFVVIDVQPELDPEQELIRGMIRGILQNRNHFDRLMRGVTLAFVGNQDAYKAFSEDNDVFSKRAFSIDCYGRER